MEAYLSRFAEFLDKIRLHKICNILWTIFFWLKTPKTYSASYIGDLEEVIPHVKQKFPGHRMIGLGTSLGGYLVLDIENITWRLHFFESMLIS